jgi:hypothetical protein
MMRLFGTVLAPEIQTALDILVIDYAGKLVALELINPGIDYWGKQPLTIGATGRNENKGYKDRASDLVALRQSLLTQTRQMWPEVEELLPARRIRRVANVPRVAQITGAHTPSPYDFERPYEDPAVTSIEGTGAA